MSFNLLYSYPTDVSIDNQELSKLILVNNKLYGTTRQGGTENSGIIYSIDTNGSNHTILHNFFADDGDGIHPSSGLTLVQNVTIESVLYNNILYGVTISGGIFNCGAIYAYILDDNTYVQIYSFPSHINNVLGMNPMGFLNFHNGKLYGVASNGGENNGGTIYSINIDGTNMTVLHAFSSLEGTTPVAGLALYNNIFYGTASVAGPNSNGTIYSVNSIPVGDVYEFNVLHVFDSDDSNNGGYPQSEVIVYNDKLYGTAPNGGTDNRGIIYSIDISGANFARIHAFDSSEGYYPHGGLVRFGHKLYGVTSQAYASDGGVFYSIDLTDNTYEIKHSFTSDGSNARSTLLLIGNILYGTSGSGGNGTGTIYSYELSVSCYNEGTKILMLRNKKDEYVPIEFIKNGDIVKTYNAGYKKVEFIGKKSMINNPLKPNNCMYELLCDNSEKLTVTGGHAIYVNSLSKSEHAKQGNKIIKKNNKIRLFAKHSDRFKKLKNINKYTYYHIVLENNDDDENYMVWANNVLSESTSKNCFLRHAYEIL